MTYLTSLTSTRVLRAALGAVLAAGLAACSAPGPNHPPGEPWDPYEKRNRSVHEFNKNLDRSVIRPVSASQSAPTRALEVLHSGLIGDYAAWLAVGVAVIAAVLATA